MFRSAKLNEGKDTSTPVRRGEAEEDARRRGGATRDAVLRLPRGMRSQYCTTQQSESAVASDSATAKLHAMKECPCNCETLVEFTYSVPTGKIRYHDDRLEEQRTEYSSSGEGRTVWRELEILEGCRPLN